jgi:hypothetical protein
VDEHFGKLTATPRDSDPSMPQQRRIHAGNVRVQDESAHPEFQCAQDSPIVGAGDVGRVGSPLAPTRGAA